MKSVCKEAGEEPRPSVIPASGKDTTEKLRSFLKKKENKIA